jgi:hypothetical protein
MSEIETYDYSFIWKNLGLFVIFVNLIVLGPVMYTCEFPHPIREWPIRHQLVYWIGVAVLITLCFIGHRRNFRRHLRPLIVDEAEVRFLSVRGTSVIIPWSEMERIETLSTREVMELLGTSGIRLVAGTRCIRVYQCIRGYDRLLRRLKEKAEQNGIPFDIPGPAAARLG